MHLRPTRSEDGPEIYKLIANNPTLGQHIYWMNGVDTPEAAQAHVDGIVDEMSRGGGVQFRIIPGTIAENGLIGGSVGVSRLKRRGEGCASCWVTEELQGNGYGRRGIETAFAYAIAALGLHTIKLDIEKGNLRSQKLARYLGFTHRGSFRDDLGDLAGDGERMRVIQVWQRDY